MTALDPARLPPRTLGEPVGGGARLAPAAAVFAERGRPLLDRGRARGVAHEAYAAFADVLRVLDALATDRTLR